MADVGGIYVIISLMFMYAQSLYLGLSCVSVNHSDNVSGSPTHMLMSCFLGHVCMRIDPTIYE